MLQGRNGATQHAGRRMARPMMLANAGTHADKSRSIEQRHHDGAGGQPHMTDHMSHLVTLDSGGGGRTALPCCQGRCPQAADQKSCAEVSRGTHQPKTCCALQHRRAIVACKQCACGWPPTPAQAQQRRTATGGQLGAQFRSLEVSRTRSPWIP